MHLVKPLWLTHPGELKDFEVYSCHISPDGSRLVTAGGDGYVRIWSIDAILNSNDPNYAKPKQLAAVSHHSGTIHTVRFSSGGKYLASGADDKIVCVYALDPNAPAAVSTFGSNEPPPVENWRVLRRLIGHDNDVQDLGWSYDSSILISVGLDSKVVVWSGHTFEKLKTIANHQSHVKGITFDPANKYFATASDDRSIKIYRFTSPPPNATPQDQLNNFILEKTILDPFLASPLTTYFRRCSWSPDGAHIAAPNATNGPVSSVAIISRGTWDGDINLIGHEGPTEVCAFSPRMFHKDPPRPDNMDANGNTLQHSVTVVACAGQDKTLSIWNTSYARPFMITQELAMKSISDLAWAPNGETLFVASLDGSIMALVFQPGELGYPASLSENEKSLSKFGAGRRVGIVEGTDALLLEESSKAGELKGVQGRMGALMGDSGSQAPPITNGANGALPALTNGSTPAAAPQAPTEPPPEQRVEKLKQRVTVTKDGKKRIAPMLVSSASGMGESSLPQTKLVSATTTAGGRSDNPHNILDLSKPYDGFPKGGLSSMLIGNKRRFAEIEGDEDRQVERRLATSVRPGGAAIVINGENGLLPPAAAGSRSEGTDPPKVLRPAIVNPSLTVSHVRLAVPKVRSVIVRTMDGSEPPKANGVDPTTGGKAENEETVILEARNATGPSRTGRPQDHDPTRINCTKKGQSLWQDFLPKAVLLVTGNTNFFAAACEDGSIYAWTPAGRRTLSALVVEAQPVIVDCRGWWLLCITALGMCYIWNLETMAAPHPPISLAPVLDIAAHSQGPHLTRSPGIIFARLNSEGRIVVAMSNGDGYTYSPNMYAWQRISEPWWAVGSQYWNTTDSSVGNVKSTKDKGPAKEANDQVSIENISAGIIPMLERNTTNQFLVQGRAFYLQRLVKALISAEGYETFESCVSVAHLENRVAAARTLGAREEFKIYLTMYIKRIGAEGLKGKIEELLRSLQGDPFGEEDDDDEGKKTTKKEETICGWKKEELLKEAVLILGKFRELQRITVPYARLLGIVNGRPDDQAMITDM
ncbi:protein HIR1 [Lophiotrema nucula]|uniref:Protein HIR n=1 Tax=Lophiotrema nucula TaxID=690887 RepID=A0A6A5ZLG6_9PLEO|nr:protein HIR1 [Lophiotrema nucula]